MDASYAHVAGPMNRLSVRPGGALGHLDPVTVSMRVMSAGDGYLYLWRTVVAGDGERDFSSPLTRYYQEKGTPPGRWLGSGVAALGEGAGTLAAGDEVSEEGLARFLGHGMDPVTGVQLGRPYGQFKTVADRIEHRIRVLPVGMPEDERAASIAAITREEEDRTQRRAVAGFDFTFSVPKSVSVLWAVSDAGTQALIADAHHAAIDDLLQEMEQDVIMTRVGFNGRGGAVAQVETRGLIATAFDHYDSRAGDPQLHTHVVVGNKVQGLDGKWRAPDGRPLFASVVALSEMYNAVLSDRISASLGLGWEQRSRGADRTPAWELEVVPDELLDEFSNRTHDINAEAERLIHEYLEGHGRYPSRTTILHLRQQATLSTRPPKETRSLAELTQGWRARAARVLDEDATGWATTNLLAAAEQPVLRVDDVAAEDIRALAASVVNAVGTRRSTWRRWNLMAEAARTSMPYRFATSEDRQAFIGLIADEAERLSLRLTPAEPASSPARFQDVGGRSVFRPKASTVYSSTRVLDAEDELLALAHIRTGPGVPLEVVEQAAARQDTNGLFLGPDQRSALAQIASSQRVVDVLVGPAGAGKTTTLGKLRTIWETEHGGGSVVGLAPSSSAAEVLAEDLGIQTENTAKWLYEHRRASERATQIREIDAQIAAVVHRLREHDLSRVEARKQLNWLHGRRHGTVSDLEQWRLHSGDLVIVDEASLAGTLSLHALAEHAADVGAKLLLVGDWAQLTAIDAGGAFGMLARERDDAPELTALHRFRNRWERAASLQLRLGEEDAIAAYGTHGRIVPAPQDDVLDAAYRGWLTDKAEGVRTVLIAETVELVTQLNLRARLDLVDEGVVTAAGIAIHDGNLAGRGDTIVTRKNDRRLTAGSGWVKNGDTWTVTAHHRDGSLTVRRAHSTDPRRIRLPAPYVAENVELGYAVTTHRAQGMTVDRAHAVIRSSSMTREALYVAMTRGRDSNIAYVSIDEPDLEEHQRLGQDITARMVLTGILHHSGAEISAHEAITREQESWTNITQLAAEYETIAQTAQRERWIDALERSGLSEEQIDQVIEADTFGPLIVELRRAEANGHDPQPLLAHAVISRDWTDVDDVASVLRWRIQRDITRRVTGSPAVPNLIAGLIPRAQGRMSGELQTALAEREELIEQRARALAEEAVTASPSWASGFAVRPGDPVRDEAWLRSIAVIAAYRDRYQVTGPDPLGPSGTGDSIRRIDRQRAENALRTARGLAGSPPDPVDAPAARRGDPDLSR
ncbi:MobF family relaxase [Gryllotalpicola reticulitermitis]|uniref:MobF family relaxase n=1 Tax=Gryllotalpicola reticulitermitis TaxID=1184153 RepID=A0ABV8Q9U8_9MICO